MGQKVKHEIDIGDAVHQSGWDEIHQSANAHDSDTSDRG